jgi:integrase
MGASSTVTLRPWHWPESPKSTIGTHSGRNEVILNGYLMNLRSRNLSPATIKAAKEYLSPFVRQVNPLVANAQDIRTYLGDLGTRCKPSTVWTAHRHLKGLFAWLKEEGDIEVNPMERIPKPVVPVTHVAVLKPRDVERLLQTCDGPEVVQRRDKALISIMLDTGLRLAEVANLSLADISEDFTVRVYGKGRKWRTVVLGTSSQSALSRWLRIRGTQEGPVWLGKRGRLSPAGIRKMIKKRGELIGLDVHPHMLRHTFVDTWLRLGGNEVDLARIAGWTTARMAEKYAQIRAAERAIATQVRLAPLDNLMMARRHTNQ